MMISFGSELIKPKAAYSAQMVLRTMQLTLTRSYAGGGGTANQTSREARFLKKLMTGTNKKKKWHAIESHSKALKEINFFSTSKKVDINATPELPKTVTGVRQEPQITTAKTPSMRVVRRVGVLNTVILDHITSILATGELTGSEDIIGLGLELSYVHVMSDFKLVNVYWYATGSAEKEAYLEERLKSLGPKLRHALITLRVMGMVPPVQFVKDTKQARLMEVERRFDTADYGEYFVPTKGANLFRPSTNPNMLPAQVKEEIEMPEKADSSQSQSSSDDESESGNLQAPSGQISALDPQFMRQNILGINRDRIMQNIQDLISKRKQRQNMEKVKKDLQQGDFESKDADAVSPEQLAIDVRNQTARSEQFLKYLKMKQIENAKAEKLESTEAYERKFYNSLRTERRLEEMKKYALDTELQVYRNATNDIEDYWPESDSEESGDEDHRNR